MFWLRYWWIIISESLHFLSIYSWAASSEFGTYRLCEQRRFRRACASVQSRQNLRCSLIQAVSQEKPWDRKPDPWPLWMAGHAQLKFVMTECSKTQIRLTGLSWASVSFLCLALMNEIKPTFYTTTINTHCPGHHPLICAPLHTYIHLHAHTHMQSRSACSTSLSL